MVVVLRARVRDYAGFSGRASRVDRYITTVVGGAGAVMEMAMSMLTRLFKRWVMMIVVHDV